MCAVPTGWLKYNAVGNVIQGTNILPFKVPLNEPMVQLLGPGERFTVRKLLATFPRLKVVIDLTNTNRYYSVQEFTHAGVIHSKLMIQGQQIPTEDNVAKFIELIESSIASCAEGELVGVHCTHGVNRTGYLICRYLMQRLHWNAEDSLNAFMKARGYPIERVNYVNELRTANKAVSTPIQITRTIVSPTSSAGVISRNRPMIVLNKSNLNKFFAERNNNFAK